MVWGISRTRWWLQFFCQKWGSPVSTLLKSLWGWKIPYEEKPPFHTPSTSIRSYGIWWSGSLLATYDKRWRGNTKNLRFLRLRVRERMAIHARRHRQSVGIKFTDNKEKPTFGYDRIIFFYIYLVTFAWRMVPGKLPNGLGASWIRWKTNAMRNCV